MSSTYTNVVVLLNTITPPTKIHFLVSALDKMVKMKVLYAVVIFSLVAFAKSQDEPDPADPVEPVEDVDTRWGWWGGSDATTTTAPVPPQPEEETQPPEVEDESVARASNDEMNPILQHLGVNEGITLLPQPNKDYIAEDPAIEDENLLQTEDTNAVRAAEENPPPTEDANPPPAEGENPPDVVDDNAQPTEDTNAVRAAEAGPPETKAESILPDSDPPKTEVESILPTDDTNAPRAANEDTNEAEVEDENLLSQEGGACIPEEGKHVGYCQMYLRCDKATGKRVAEHCGGDLVWNPLNPDKTLHVHGGNCDIWNNLSGAVEEQYRNAPDCLGAFWKALGKCNREYEYQAAGGTNRNVLRLKCTEGLVFSNKKKSCQRCQDVIGDGGNPCC